MSAHLRIAIARYVDAACPTGAPPQLALAMYTLLDTITWASAQNVADAVIMREAHDHCALAYARRGQTYGPPPFVPIPLPTDAMLWRTAIHGLEAYTSQAPKILPPQPGWIGQAYTTRICLPTTRVHLGMGAGAWSAEPGHLVAIGFLPHQWPDS